MKNACRVVVTKAPTLKAKASTLKAKAKAKAPSLKAKAVKNCLKAALRPRPRHHITDC